MKDLAIQALSNISAATVVLYTIAILFVGGGIYRFLEKYRMLRNLNEEKGELIDTHTKQIENLNSKIDKITEKLDTFGEAIDRLSTEATEREARRLRKGILQFADDLRNGSKPSKDMYREIFESNKEYLAIIDRINMKNGFTETEMKWIEQNYQDDFC